MLLELLLHSSLACTRGSLASDAHVRRQGRGTGTQQSSRSLPDDHGADVSQGLANLVACDAGLVLACWRRALS